MAPGIYDLLKYISYWILIKRQSVKPKHYVKTHLLVLPPWESLEKWGLKIIFNKFFPALHLSANYIWTSKYSGWLQLPQSNDDVWQCNLFVKSICSKWWIKTISSLKSSCLLAHSCVPRSLFLYPFLPSPPYPSPFLCLHKVKTQLN